MEARASQPKSARGEAEVVYLYVQLEAQHGAGGGVGQRGALEHKCTGEAAAPCAAASPACPLINDFIVEEYLWQGLIFEPQDAQLEYRMNQFGQAFCKEAMSKLRKTSGYNKPLFIIASCRLRSRLNGRDVAATSCNAPINR